MSKTFTDEAKKQYEKACVKNSGQQEIYYCATSSPDLTERNLDLNSKYVFCDPKEQKESKKNELKEYRLQAFMIKAALKDEKFLLPIKDKEWVLLDAERNFAEEDLSEVGDERRLDILAYEKETQSYIVLELKVQRKLQKASAELLQYTSTMKKHIEKANEFYAVNAEKVKGYIVWHSTEKPRKNEKPWGLIEYDKELLDDIANMKFALVRDPLPR